MNAIQDAIIELREETQKIITPKGNHGPDPQGWFSEISGSMSHWECGVAAADMSIDLEMVKNAEINAVRIKCYPVSDLGISFKLMKQHNYFDVAATAPVWTQVGSTLNPTSAAAWNIVAWTGLTESVDEHYQWAVYVDGPDVGDLIAAVQVTYLPYG